nr:hypothetical protein [Paenibacillus lutrae]
MSGKIGYCVDKAVSVLPYILKIWGLQIPQQHIVSKLLNVLFLKLAWAFRHRNEHVDVFHDLSIRKLYFI